MSKQNGSNGTRKKDGGKRQDSRSQPKPPNARSAEIGRKGLRTFQDIFALTLRTLEDHCMNAIDGRDADTTFRGVGQIWKGVQIEMNYAKMTGKKIGRTLLPAST